MNTRGVQTIAWYEREGDVVSQRKQFRDILRGPSWCVRTLRETLQKISETLHLAVTENFSFCEALGGHAPVDTNGQYNL